MKAGGKTGALMHEPFREGRAASLPNVRTPTKKIERNNG